MGGASPPPIMSRLDRPHQRLQPQQISFRAEPADHAGCYLGDVRTVPELFPPVNIRQVDFYDRNFDRAQCVPDRNRSVRVGARIDQNPMALFPGILNPINQLPFVIALQKLDFQAMLRPKIATRLLDLRQCRFPVNLWLTSTKQIQIRTVQDIDCFHANRLTKLIAYTEDHKDRQDKNEPQMNADSRR
jgi:hypothetical protein